MNGKIFLILLVYGVLSIVSSSTASIIAAKKEGGFRLSASRLPTLNDFVTHKTSDTSDSLARASGTKTAHLNEDVCGSSVTTPNPKSIPKIVNGTQANIGEWPWQAMVLGYSRKNLWFNPTCGGTLIAKQWVLTAAHCFEGVTASNTHVALGATLKNLTETSVKLAAVASVNCHASYSKSHPTPFINDICLLKLAAEVSYTDYVIPACLPAKSTDVTDGEMCVITGWGDTKGTGSPDTLREAVVQIVNKFTCASWYRQGGTTLPTDHICAGYQEGLIDTCQGDSGGPLVCSEANSGSSSYVLRGITSFGSGCAIKERPGVYTSVVEYLDWIDTTISRKSGPDECFSAPLIPCGGTITTTGTIIRTPIDGNETWLYPANSHCSWKIEAPVGLKIQLEFICFFQVEMKGSNECYDYMSINSSGAGIDLIHCGSKLPLPYFINHTDATISFNSDATRQTSGFVIRVNFVDDPMSTTPNSTATVSNYTSTAPNPTTVQQATVVDIATMTKSSNTETTTNGTPVIKIMHGYLYVISIALPLLLMRIQ